MKILVLGATGQVGQALTNGLSQTEHQVCVLVRRASGLQFPENVTVLERADFTPDVFRAALSGVDHVIYGIGLPEQFQFDDSVFDRVNCQLLQTFLQALASSGVRRMTYISTYEVFEVIDNDIDETHPIADESEMTPYFQSMVRAYRMAVDFARAHDIRLTTIHPAAVYGGINTGGGITDYMENLASRNWPRLPFINPSSFPVVHVQSLTDAIVKSLDTPGPYIVSDQMTSLSDIAQTMRKQAWSYVPMTIPLWLIMIGIRLLEAMAKIFRIKPFASTVQIAFLIKGWKPDPSKAIRELDWKPLPLEEGISRFLAARRPARGDDAHRMTGTGRIQFIAKLELFTAVGLFLYWVLYFTAGAAPPEPPPGYFVFQDSFTYADLILAVLLARAAMYLLSGDPIRRVIGRGLSLVSAGALLFLGGLDISFNIQNGIYLAWSFDMALEVLVNIWCLGFGFLLAYEFAFDAYQRY
jgi:nucleoside-diphosphate-sugar epimerase